MDPISLTQIQAITNKSAMDTLALNYPLSTVQPVSRHDFKTGILNDNISKSRLFPQGLVVRHSQMFELLECNVDDLYHGRVESVFLGTKDSEGHFESLSIGTDLSCELGSAYDIAYYGKVDTNLIMAHFVMQLVNVHEDRERNIYITLLAPYDKVVTDELLFQAQLTFLALPDKTHTFDFEQYILDIFVKSKSKI